MKKQFLSLALLLSSASVVALYNVHTTISVDGHAESYDWNSNEILVAESKNSATSSGIVIESRITEEHEDAVVINVTVARKTGEELSLLQTSDTTAPLGQEVSVKCPAENIEASISFVVTKQDEAEDNKQENTVEENKTEQAEQAA